MSPILTAEPEQLKSTVLTLKRHIDRVEADNLVKAAKIDTLRAERDQARAWARAWKQSAKYWRAEDDATEEMRQAAVAEMARYRRALDDIADLAPLPEYLHGNITGLAGRALEIAHAALIHLEWQP